MPDLNFPQLNIEAVLVLGAAAVAAALTVLIPLLAAPFNMLFVMVHELGHVTATLLTGGNVKQFLIRPDGTGTTQIIGNINPLMAAAGYLGTSIFSVGLLLLGGLPYAAPYILAILGVLLIVAVVIYGKWSSFTTLLIGLGFGLAFIILAWQGALVWSVFLLYFLALEGILLALTHLWQLADYVKHTPLNQDDDARKMSQLAGCSPWFWIVSWFFLSVVILGSIFWFVWLRPLDWQPLTLK